MTLKVAIMTLMVATMTLKVAIMTPYVEKGDRERGNRSLLEKGKNQR